MTLQELAIEEYKKTNVAMRPLYPAILVRVLPKQGTSGLLYLPEVAAKPIYEGIVLAVWEPVRLNWKGKDVVVTCDLKAGDHVLFPHWSGENVPGLDSEEYRLVPSRGYLGSAGNKEAGEILGVLSYDCEDVKTKLREITCDTCVTDKLLEAFDITVKIKTPRTTSGNSDGHKVREA